MVRRLILLMLGLAVAGCTSLATPTAKVTDVAVARQTAQGARVLVTVKLHNPNDVVLPLVRTHYRVAVAGLKPFSFTAIPDQALPADGDQTLTLPAAFASDGRPINQRVYHVTGDATIQPPGNLWQIFHQSGVPLPAADFSASGRLR